MESYLGQAKSAVRGSALIWSKSRAIRGRSKRLLPSGVVNAKSVGNAFTELESAG